MATWHPPIPAGRLYSSDALDLGPALAMLVWCYDNIERDGTIEIQLNKLAVEFGKSYRTIKDWWAALRAGPFFCETIDRGKRGWIVRLADDWIDWHVMANNYPSRPGQGQDTALDDKGEGKNSALEARQVPVKSRSSPDEGQNTALEASAYKVDHHDQNPSSSKGGDERKKKPTALTVWLIDQGMGAAEEFGHLDEDAAKADFTRRRRAGDSFAQIVRAWRVKPPARAPSPNGRHPSSIAADANTPEETARKLREITRKP